MQSAATKAGERSSGTWTRMGPITQAEYARSRKARGLLGGSKAGVLKAVRAGRITLVNGLVDPEQADLDWGQNTNRAQQRPPIRSINQPQSPIPGDSQLAIHTRLFGEAKAGYDRQPAMFVKDPASGKTIKNPYLAIMQEETAIIGKLADENGDANSSLESMSEAQTRKEIALANLRELEEKKERGELVELNRFSSVLFNFVSNAKSRFLGIGNKVSPELAIETEEPKIKAIIDSEIREALTELSRWEPTI